MVSCRNCHCCGIYTVKIHVYYFFILIFLATVNMSLIYHSVFIFSLKWYLYATFSLNFVYFVHCFVLLRCVWWSLSELFYIHYRNVMMLRFLWFLCVNFLHGTFNLFVKIYFCISSEKLLLSKFFNIYSGLDIYSRVKYFVFRLNIVFALLRNKIFISTCAIHKRLIFKYFHHQFRKRFLQLIVIHRDVSNYYRWFFSVIYISSVFSSVLRM